MNVSLLDFNLISTINHNMKDINSCGFNFFNTDCPVNSTRPISPMWLLTKLKPTLKKNICLGSDSQQRPGMIFSRSLNAVGAEMQPQGGFQQLAWNPLCWLRDLKHHQSLNPYRLVFQSTMRQANTFTQLTS